MRGQSGEEIYAEWSVCASLANFSCNSWKTVLANSCSCRIDHLVPYSAGIWYLPIYNFQCKVNVSLGQPGIEQLWRINAPLEI